MTDENGDIRPTVSRAIEAVSALPPDLSDYERKLLYGVIERIPRLPPKIRYALNKELDALSEGEIELELTPGLPPTIINFNNRRRHSTAARNEERQQIRALMHYFSLERRKAILKAQRVHAFHKRAYEEEAKAARVSVKGLEKLFRMHLPKGERRALRESAQRSARENQTDLPV
jgi:hypothetical protein